MRIVCPSCTAAYDVPASVIAAGRVLRCARCNTDFPAVANTGDDAGVPSHPAPAADPGPPPVTTEAAPAAIAPPRIMPAALVRVDEAERLLPSVGAVADRPPARTDRRRVAAVLGAWALSLAVLAAGTAAAIAWRAPIMHAWPASTRLYAAFGYSVGP